MPAPALKARDPWADVAVEATPSADPWASVAEEVQTPAPMSSAFAQPTQASADPWKEVADDVAPIQSAPVSAPVVATTAPKESSLWDVFTNSASRGWRGLKQLWPTTSAVSNTNLLNELDAIDRGENIPYDDLSSVGKQYASMRPEQRKQFITAFSREGIIRPRSVEDIQTVAQLEAEKRQFPAPASVQAIMQSKTTGEALGLMAEHPLEFLASIGPESFVQTLPGLVAAIPAAAVGPAGPMATLGANSYAIELANGVMSELQERGVNTSDPQALQLALKDRVMMNEIMTTLQKRAAVVGGVDALSGGVASKTLLPAKVLAERQVARKVAEMAIQTPIQGALGAAGEAGGQLAAGEEFKPGEILAEAVGELASAPVEVAALQSQQLRDAVARARSGPEAQATPAEIDEILGRTRGGAQLEPGSPDAANVPGESLDAIRAEAEAAVQQARAQSQKPATPPAAPVTMPPPGSTGSPPPASESSRVLAPTVEAVQGSASPSPVAAPTPQAPAAEAQQAQQAQQPTPEAITSAPIPQPAPTQVPPAPVATKTEVPPAAPSPISTPGPAPQAAPAQEQIEVNAGGTTPPIQTPAPTNIDVLASAFGNEKRAQQFESLIANGSEPALAQAERMKATLPAAKREAVSQWQRQQSGAIEQKSAVKTVAERQSTVGRLGDRVPGYTVEESPANESESGFEVTEGDENAQAEFDRLSAEQRSRDSEKRSAQVPAPLVAAPQPLRAANVGVVRGGESKGASPKRLRAGKDTPSETRHRASEGKPLRVYRGSNTPLAKEHFDPKALGHATDHPTSGLGVWFTASEEDARQYGTMSHQHELTINNPKVYDSNSWGDVRPESLQEATAFRERLRAQGHDGIVLDSSDVGGEIHYVAFAPEQSGAMTEVERDEVSPDDAQNAEPEEFDLSSEFDDEDTEGGSLADTSAASKTPGKTGPAPSGQQVEARAGTRPSDPLRRIAARKATEAQAAIERKDTTPEVAPKRDAELGRSTFDTMWRDFLGIPQVGPMSPTQEEALRRIQNAPMQQQLKTATKMTKEQFAFKEIELDPKLSSREAMDVLLDAYNNLHTMANVMGLPRESMGFNGQLTLRLAKSINKSKGTRGQFEWSFKGGFSASVLSLARRADSFTHEWLHALDLNLLMRFYKSRKFGVSDLSQFTTRPLDALPPAINKAFTDVMRSLFLVDDASAKQLAELSAQATQQKAALELAKSRTRVADPNVKTERNANVEKAQRELAATLDEINALLKDKSSQFHQGSRYVDALSGREYFSLPTEMLARAGEAWMGNRIGQQAGTEFLSGSPDFYNNSSDRIMQLVYPNAAERESIFQKFDALFAALASEQYFPGEKVAARIPTETAFDKEMALAAKKNEQAGMARETYEAARDDFVNTMSAVSSAVKGELNEAAKSAAQGILSNTMNSSFVNSFRSAAGRLDSLIRSYKDAPQAQALVRKFARMLAINPGAREETSGPVVQDKIDRKIALYHTRIDNIAKEHQLDPSDSEQMAALYEETARPTEQVRQELSDHNEFLKERLSEPELSKAEREHIEHNIKVNEQALAATPLPAAPTTAIQKAALAIRKLQDQLYYDAQQAGIDVGYVSNYLRRTLNHEAVAQHREDFLDKAELAYRATNELNARKLERQIARTKSEPARAALQAELAEIKRLSPRRQAEEYLFSLTVPDVYTPEGLTTPSTKFTKHRTLAPAADLLLADYYDQNPIRSLYNSASSSVYRTTFAEMFGANGEKLDVMRKEMLAAGVKETDLAIMDDAMRIAFGQTGNFVSPADAFANWAMLLAQMKLLGRSAFTNLMEPAVTGIRTGNVLDSVRALANAYLPLLNRAEAAEQQFEMETLGLVASTANETVFANRSGLSGENPMLRKVYTGFGKLAKLEFLTRRARFGAYRVLSNYLHFMALQTQDGKADAQREAHDELNELGIPRDKHAEFAEFIRSFPKGRMGTEMLMRSDNAEMKEMYGNAMHVLLRQSVQSPQRVERARGSFHPVGRFVYSITNFTRSFERNVIVRNYKLVKTAEGMDRKSLAMLRFGGTAGTLVMMTLLASMAREWWDDPERFKKKMEGGDYLSPQGMLNALDRAGFTGRFSPLYNMWAKSKFDREVSALAAGAVPSFYLDSFAKMAGAFFPGTEPTPKQERAGWAALYDLTVGMGAPLAAVLAKATGPLGWVATTKVQSRGWRDAFAEKMVPQTLEERAAEDRANARANETDTQRASRERRLERSQATRQRNLQRKYGDQP